MRRIDRSTIGEGIVNLVRDIYGEGDIPLHRPVFVGNERTYLVQCIDSNFVSSVGERIVEFEQQMAQFVGTAHAVATVNGTAALHIALEVAGVCPGEEVITQALTFVATCNAISYTGARPVFVDVDLSTLGMSPESLRNWLEANTRRESGRCINTTTGARIAACVPMHTFGIPADIAGIVDVCDEFGIPVIEDAAEALGSRSNGAQMGTFGKLSTLSFNGNKIITTGGGGMILTNSQEIAKRAKHISTTAKQPHAYEYYHDVLGYNYRMPNLNAALGVAQLEYLPTMLEIKAEVAGRYRQFCSEHGLKFVDAPPGTLPNFWLNAIVVDDRQTRDTLLEGTNAAGVMTRPVWRLMNDLPMYRDCQRDDLRNSRWLADRVVNLPSSVPDSEFGRLLP